MPAKKIPKKKLACATKETKNGKEYTTCYEKKKTPARTFRVKKKANKYEFIGTAKIKDLVKTKTGWSVQASKVKNRGTSFWADSGM